MRPRIGRLLLGVHALILVVPVGAVLLLQFYDTLLVQQTERRLIGEAATLGEVWRDAWLHAQGLPPTAAGESAPPGLQGEELHPVAPVIDLGSDLLGSDFVLPPTKPATRFAASQDGPAWRAGRTLMPMIDRVRRINLSGARILDREGCVVASSGEGIGECIDDLPEVRAALAGRYAAVARERMSDHFAPLGGISRRGDIRVYAALPVFSDGRVIGVVRMSRTSVDPLESLWEHRWKFAAALLIGLLLTAAVTTFLTVRIARPVEDITQAAEAIAGGDTDRHFPPASAAPAEVHRLAASLERMTRQLTERADYVAEYAAHVSHELKTPVTAIRGASELLLDSWDAMDEPRRRRFLEHIDADAERIQRLVTSLLALARIEHVAQMTEGESAVATVLEAVAGRHPGRVTLRLRSPPQTRPLPSEHLDRAVANLVDNAVRHGGPGEVIVTAETAADGRLRVSVQDHGPGIPVELRAQIYDRFFTTARDAGGTGLGLTLVRAVVDRHAGDLEMESSAAGTVFRLTV